MTEKKKVEQPAILGHKKRKPAFLLSAVFLMMLLIPFKSQTFEGLTRASFVPSAVQPRVDDDDTLHIHLISGSEEYESESSLKIIKQVLEQSNGGIKITASWGVDAGTDLPNIEQLGEADLMVVFARRMNLPEDQLNYIIQHIEAEKPVIGIRTASHAFQGYLELDDFVFGGDYDGHGEDEFVDVSMADDAEGHPILNNVNSWNRPGKLYHNPNLGPNAQPLLYGRGLNSDMIEPLAWTNIYGDSGRAFYTSMGLPTDFEDENFIRMFTNAVSWTTGYQMSGIDEAITESEEEAPGTYQSMDYGPIIAESITLDWPENSLVRKGLAIRLDHNAAMIFDTDLMHFAAGTVGGWLDISETDYTSYKGSKIPSLEGRQVFANSGKAGWAKDGSFNGPREDELGNLPRDWVHYKGYYRNGDQAVLSYTVGGTNVLELPEAVSIGDSVAFSRTIRVEPSDKTMKALVTEKQDSWSIGSASEVEITFNRGADVLGVRLMDPSGDAKLNVGKDGLVELQFPPSDSHRTVRVMLLEMSISDQNRFNEELSAVKNAGLADLKSMAQGGPTQWDEEIEVAGIIADGESGYVVDRIPLPVDNPGGSWMRLSGLDFFEDGTRAAVSTWNGDVWIVSGIDESLQNVKWHRYASGLFYPMGIAIVNDEIYVTERSQLTRLHDLNGDGEADHYENFNNDGIVNPMAHSLGLEVDSNGDFFFFKNGNRVPSEVAQHGSLIRVSSDGSTREVYARGYRGGNTLGIGSNDVILAADQEGRWVPVDRIDVMEPGGFYGDRRHGGANLEVGDFNPPLAWTPKRVNNSSGFITYAGDSRWGPLSNQWILGSYGQRTLYAVLSEEMGGKLQGGIVKLPVESASGLMRGSISPYDGQLYVVGLRGWQTLASEDASFERIRYTGGNVNLPENIHIDPNGVQIVFTDPLDPVSAENIDNYSAERWEYIYSEGYGSPEVSLENPEEEGRDAVEITAASVSNDGRKVYLEIPDMRSVMQMGIYYDLAFADGQQESNAIYHTVNWLSEADADDMPEWQKRLILRVPETEEDEVEETELASEDNAAPEWFQQGKISFERNCTSCHGASGIAPSLETSEWAGGSREALVRILLQGKIGNRGVMTPFSWMDDEEIASIISYIRSNWHGKEQVKPAEVSQIREATEDRDGLWTEEELSEF